MYRTIIFLTAFMLSACNAQDLVTKVPPEGPAKYPQDFNIIGGTEVPANDPKYSSIVRIATDGASCTASVVGPKAILTAAHCGKTDAISKFKINGKDYSAKITRSPLYPGIDHDLALGLVTEEMLGVKYESVTTAPVKVSDVVTMYGYGCIQPGGGGGNDGILRFGDSIVTSLSAKDYVAKKPGGAALCFGDSGGPSFILGVQAGVASKGNISDTSYFANLSLTESQDFLKKWAKDNATDICGITKSCNGPQPEVIKIASGTLGELQFTLKPETLDPEFVKRHMEMLMSFFEHTYFTGKPPVITLPHPEY